MPVDLSTQTRDLFTRIDERQEPIGLTEITTLAQTRADASPPAAIVGLGEAASSDKVVKRPWWRNFGVAAAALAVVLVLVGSVAWLSRAVESTDPADQTTITEPDSSPPTTLALDIVVPAPGSLNRRQMEHQAEFLSAFQNFGFLGGGGCSGNDPGPYECEGAIYSPTLGGPVEFAFTVSDQDPGGRDPGEVSGPDDMQQSSLYAAAVRDVAEDGLAALYVWALATYPDSTQRLCQSEFSGDDETLAWNPGYVTSYECGAHLAGLLVEFSPAETIPSQTLPSSETGVWYPVPVALAAADSEGFNDVLFDVADTPYGIIGTSGQGLWISQEGIEWEPYARDSIEFMGGVSFARVASSDVGILVVEPAAGAQAWYTADGSEWVEVKIPELLGRGGGSARIAATNDAFVVAARGRIWRSTDGIDWTESVVDPDVFDGEDAGISTLEATPFGFVAGGFEGPNDSRYPVIWHSVDGIAWSKDAVALGDPRPGNEWIYDLAGSELGVVAVTSSDAIWFSPDAVNWTEVLPAPSRAGLSDHAVGASSTGFVVASGDPQGASEPRLLSSLDGTTWMIAEYEKPPARFPEGYGFSVIMREAIPLGNGFLIATEGGSSPVHVYEP
jgi:hypothetical protein